MRPIIQIAARMIKEDPTLLDDIDAANKDDQLSRLRQKLKHAIPELAQKEHCPNCGASMVEYEDILDINDALLLFQMAKIVRTSQEKGVGFTAANKISVSSSTAIGHTQKCRTSKCAKLGLIAKAGSAQWSITRRGWDALSGKAVPRMRITFRGKILERPEETITLAEVFAEHGRKMQEKQRRKQSLKHDQRFAASDYVISDWINVHGLHQGELL